MREIKGEDSLKNRLMELGVTKGTKIYIKRFAPFKSPVEIVVRGYNLCINLENAKNIIID